MNRVINSFINTVKKIKSEIFGKISDFILLYVEKIKSGIFGAFSDFSFLDVGRKSLNWSLTNFGSRY